MYYLSLCTERILLIYGAVIRLLLNVTVCSSTHLQASVCSLLASMCMGAFVCVSVHACVCVWVCKSAYECECACECVRTCACVCVLWVYDLITFAHCKIAEFRSGFWCYPLDSWRNSRFSRKKHNFMGIIFKLSKWIESTARHSNNGRCYRKKYSPPDECHLSMPLAWVRVSTFDDTRACACDYNARGTHTCFCEGFICSRQLHDGGGCALPACTGYHAIHSGWDLLWQILYKTEVKRVN